jgi:Flp pilus assembly protein TadD
MKSQALSVGSAVALVLALAACGGASQPAESPAGGNKADEGTRTTGAGTTNGPPASGGTATTTMDDAPHSPEGDAGWNAFQAGKFDEARASFEAATKKNPKDFGSFHNLGQACEKLGDRACAETAYKAALAIKPDLETAAVNLSALFVDSGRLDDALATAKQGLAKHPGSGPLHESLGIALAAQGQQDLASKEFSQAIQISPQDAQFHYTFAHWLNAWHVRGAVPHLDTAASIVKDDYAMLAGIAFEYRMAAATSTSPASELGTCIKIYDRAVHLKDGGEVRTGRALCKLALKDEKGAFEDLKAAVETEPTYATGHYYLAGRLALSKKFKEAAAEYGKYLELAPDGSLAKQAAERKKAAEEAAKKSK